MMCRNVARMFDEVLDLGAFGVLDLGVLGFVFFILWFWILGSMIEFGLIFNRLIWEFEPGKPPNATIRMCIMMFKILAQLTLYCVTYVPQIIFSLK